MTVDPLISWETGSLVKPEKKFFPSHIPVQHHQLRHIISSPCSNIVYFASNDELYCVNTATRKRALVGKLPFVPKCSATGCGWYCAGGGRGGDFVAVYIPHTSSGATNFGRYDTPGEDRSWSDRWPNEPLFDYQLRLMIQEQGLNGRVKKLGSDIVNSISIHRIRSSRPNELDDVVAILTNNDKTVRVYSLSQDAELSVLELPFPVNHASLSPDQKTIVVVGDKEHIYFYRRIDTAHGSGGSSSTAQYPRYHWAQRKQLLLHKPREESSSAYFTTAWSPNGRLCATASEEGYISVLDMDKLENGHEDDVVIAVVPSSRPQLLSTGIFCCGPPGAVRTMTFSKEPWDLLFWTEGSGRLCVGDVRTGLKSRQVISLDTDAGGVTKMDFLEIVGGQAASNDTHPGLRRGPLHYTARSNGSSTVPDRIRSNGSSALSEQARSNGSSVVPDQAHFSGLLRQEQSLLDTLRHAPQHSDSLEERGLNPLAGRRSAPFSINYMSGQVRSGSSTPATDSQSDTSRQISSRFSQDTLSAWQNRSNLTNPMRNSRWPEGMPRLGSSSLFPANPSSRQAWQYGPVGSSEPPRPPTTHPLLPLDADLAGTPGIVQPHEDWSHAIPDETDREAWRVVQEHLIDQQLAAHSDTPPAPGTFLEDLPPPDHPPLPRYRTSALRDLRELRDRDAERLLSAGRAELPPGVSPLGFPMRYADLSRFQARSTRHRDRWADDTRYEESSVDPDPRFGPLTTGIALDDDGETIYVGTDQGIFVLKINAQERMTWASIVPR